MALHCLPDAPAPGTYDAVILAVAHRDFIETGATGIRQWAKATIQGEVCAVARP